LRIVLSFFLISIRHFTAIIEWRRVRIEHSCLHERARAAIFEGEETLSELTGDFIRSFLRVGMIEGTVFLGTFSSRIAWFGLVVEGMVLKLLPSVAILTVSLIGAATFIITKDLSLRPVWALNSVVFVLVGVSSKILRVVGIDTLVSIMFIDIWTKDGFVFVEVEELVLFEIVEEFNLDFRFIVGK